MAHFDFILNFIQCRLNFADALVSTAGKVVFPNADYAPAKFAKLVIYPPVPLLVGRQFLFPERTIARRNFAMFWTAMPETTICKNCQPVSPEKKIRSAKNILVPAPTGDVVGAK